MAARKPSLRSSKIPKKRTRPTKAKSNFRTARERRLPIVALGGSAGGFEALLRFFRTVPKDSGMAFVVVLHLDPTRASELAALLASHTTIPVSVARDGESLRPNRAYVIPPNRYLRVEHGAARLSVPTEPRGLRLAVDALFESVAHDAEDCAIGVILSGNGADGSSGLRAIKGSGGLAIVQDPSTSEYEGMPRAAIATGVVDVVLPIEAMMVAIRRFVAHDYVAQNGNSESIVNPGAMSGILNLLHTRRNVDFSGYKKGTLTRRIHRRMGLRQLSRPADYLKVLRNDPAEVAALFNDVLIQVTRFFREPESWKDLEKGILMQLVREAKKGVPLRAWVPGCATGEEAYSLAMLLIELREKAQKDVSIQIFASDLDAQALDIGRAGFYHGNNLADVSTQRLKRFFLPDGDGFRVKQQLRDAVVFAQHNVLADPPFSRLDLVSCRNLLIYFEAPLQKRALELFHFALKPGHFLLLGSSETIGLRTDLFQPISRKQRIYRRLGGVHSAPLNIGAAGMPELVRVAPEGMPAAREKPLLLRARDQVLERYAPASVLLNRKLEIVSLFGPTQDYFTQPSGPLTADFLSWVKEGMRGKLRMGLQTALRKNQKTEVRGMPMRRGSHTYSVACTVDFLRGVGADDELLLAVFRDERQEPAVSPAQRHRQPGAKLVQQLEYELKAARDELQTSVEQLESSNEELRATNEEILSINEELQSTNEELETSKEELQSVNEELNTVNSQLELKISEVQLVNDDLYNLLASIDTSILFLDRDLSIRRFTSAASRIFRLIPSDVGRPLADITTLVEDPALLDDAHDVLSRLTPVEREIVGGQSGYLRRVVPYRSGTDRIEGVVVIYTDISDRVRADALVREARDFAEGVLETLREPLLVLDATLTVRSANTSFFESFKLEPAQTLGRRLFDVGSGEWNRSDVREWIARLSKGTGVGEPLELHQEFAGVGPRVLILRARPLDLASPSSILLAIEDATRRSAAEEARNDVLRQMVSWEEKERHRLALELHDEAGQHVTAFLLGLAALKTSQSDPVAAALVQRLQELADELARRLHGLSLELRPTALDEHGLGRALQSYVEDLSHRHRLDIDYQVTGPWGDRLPAHLETVLYRVVQEALTNVLKHAEATKVSIVLDRRREELRLAVEDNGCGFSLGEASQDPGHLGLRGMEERAHLAGGFFSVESHPGMGTTIFVRVPLDGRERGETR